MDKEELNLVEGKLIFGDEKLILVVDTNIVLSALLKEGLTRKILLSGKLILFSPQELSFEVEKHALELGTKVGLNKETFLLLFEFIFKKAGITQVNHKNYTAFCEVAKSVCPFGHLQDWPFIALALKENVPLWSNDSALKKQNLVKVITTPELIQKLSLNPK